MHADGHVREGLGARIGHKKLGGYGKTLPARALPALVEAAGGLHAEDKSVVWLRTLLSRRLANDPEEPVIHTTVPKWADGVST
jgi:hypothetical protein